MILKRFFFLVLPVLLYTCKKESNNTSTVINNTPKLTLQSYKLLAPEASNIHFLNSVKESQNFNYLLYPFIYFGGGVSTGDINNDGLPDIYFTGNMGQNKLYLNQGNLQFKDITQQAKVEGVYNHWTTGSTMADVNNDGYLDIYVSVAGPGNIRKNLLYINNKNNTFKEEAVKYGIACQDHSMQSTFFDYDNDGDLDLYVGNYPPSGFNQKSAFFSTKMNEKSLDESDRLYRNDGDKFVDVTKSSGILNYGLTLGLNIADYNNDGWSDIYVSNDFNSKDFLYINQGNGKFEDKILTYTKHTSNFGMGIDSGDINNDGFIDFMQLDMMGNTSEKQKSNMSAMNTSLFYDMVDKGLHHQYMKNVLQLNTGSNSFLDIGEFAGVANTDWSWGVLLMDMNNNGFKDVFVTNGMLRDVNDNDFNALFRIQKAYGKVDASQYINWINRMPSKPVENFAFHNNGDLSFKTSKPNYGLNYKGFSNGAAYADLDLDGDLDLVVNNLNAKSHVYENRLESKEDSKYLRLKLKGKTDNSFGIGAKVCLYSQGEKQYEALNLTRGYESSVEPVLHFGLDTSEIIDSLEINWPKGKTEMMYGIKTNQLVEITQGEGGIVRKSKTKTQSLFTSETPKLSTSYSHIENVFNDFEREILLPHKMSQTGPALAVADINSDGLDDFYIGGAKGFSGGLYVQNKEGSFYSVSNKIWNNDKMFEDVSATFFDANNDGLLDLYVVSGGNEMPLGDRLYKDRLYLNNGDNKFIKTKMSLPDLYISGSCVESKDYDKDGDLDLFIGGRQTPGNYPLPCNSYILKNESTNGNVIFKDVTNAVAPELLDIGMVTDAIWEDIDSDGWQDLIIVGEWMSPTILKNTNGIFKDESLLYGLGTQVGWWNTIVSADLDSDGDKDLIIGNLGLNYKYKATINEPFKIFADDFDANGKLDIVLGYYDAGELFPVRGRECSSQQMPFIKKKFPNYTTFSKANLIDVYTSNQLDKAISYEANTFASAVFMNDSGRFTPKPLPNYAQLSSINTLLVDDINNDGHVDLLIGGNKYGSEVETPRNDASEGLFFKGKGDGEFFETKYNKDLLNIKGEIKHIAKINMANGVKAFLVARNNDELLIIKTQE